MLITNSYHDFLKFKKIKIKINFKNKNNKMGGCMKPSEYVNFG